MKFEHATQNGITQATPLRTRPSNLGLAISTNDEVYGVPIYLKALSNAAMWKTEPVEYWSNFTPKDSTLTETILLGTADFVSTTTSVFVGAELGTGTHEVYALWPGEGRYASVTTEDNPLTIVVNSAPEMTGTFELEVNPATSTLVVDEGTATFTCVFTTQPISKTVTGDVRFLVDGFFNSIQTLSNNRASISLDSLTVGEHTVQAIWAGDEQSDGIRYQGRSTSTVYRILSGALVDSTLTLSLTSTKNVYQEGTITLTANLSGVQSLPGNVSFYANGNLIGVSAVSTNSSVLTINNTFPIGVNTFSAVWDGNQNSKPKYEGKTSNTVSFTVIERATPPSMTLTVTPDPTAFGAVTTYTVTANTSSAFSGSVSFFDTNSLIGTASFTNNVAKLEKRFLSTGTHVAFAKYVGSSSAPKYYSTNSNSVSYSVTSGYDLGHPMTITIKGDSYQGYYDPYVQGETISVTAQLITDGIPLVGESGQSAVVDFYHNGTKFDTKVWNHYSVYTTATNTYLTYNYSTATYVVATTGTHTFLGKWNGVYTSQYGYLLGTESTSSSISVVSGYNTPARLTMSVGSPRVIDESITYTVDVANKIFTYNTVTIYANNVELTTITTTSNTINYTTSAIVDSGTYTIQAYMPGDVLLGHRYNGTYSNAVSIFVDTANTLDGSIVLTASTSSKVVAGLIGFTARLTGTNVVLNGSQDGIVSFRANGIEFASTNFTNNVATVVDTAGILTVGTYTIQAVYQGRTGVKPKYFSKSSNSLSQTIYDKKGPDYFRLGLTSPKAVNVSKYPGASDGSYHQNYYKYGRDGKFNPKMIARAKMFFLQEPRYLNEGHYPTGTVNLYDYNTSTGVSTLIGTTSTIGENLTVGFTTGTIQNLANDAYIMYCEINSTDTNITSIVPGIDEYFDVNLTEGDILNVMVNGQKWNPYSSYESGAWTGARLVWRLFLKDYNGKQRYFLMPYQLGPGVFSEDGITETSIVSMSTRLRVDLNNEIKTAWNTLSNATLTLRLDPRIPTAKIEWNPAEANQIGYGARNIYATYSGDSWHTTSTSYINQYAANLEFHSPVQVDQYYKPDISTFAAYPKAYLDHAELIVSTTSTSRTAPITVTAEMYDGAPLGQIKLYVRPVLGGPEVEKGSGYAVNGKVVFPAFTLGAGNWTIIARIPEDSYIYGKEISSYIEKV